jgi:multidrug efflux pump subunit AcrA (membrane-fusion protein)
LLQAKHEEALAAAAAEKAAVEDARTAAEATAAEREAAVAALEQQAGELREQLAALQAQMGEECWVAGRGPVIEGTLPDVLDRAAAIAVAGVPIACKSSADALACCRLLCCG